MPRDLSELKNALTTVDPPRERLLRVATELFAAQGYASTSVREIVQAAGVTKPTLYYHFGNKEGLFQSLVRERLGQDIARTEQAVAADGGCLERLESLCSWRLERIHRDPEFAKFIGRFAVNPGLAPQVDIGAYMAQQGCLLSALFQQGMDSGELRVDDPVELAISFQGIWSFRVMASLCGGPLMGPSTVSTLLRLFATGVTP